MGPVIHWPDQRNKAGVRAITLLPHLNLPHFNLPQTPNLYRPSTLLTIYRPEQTQANPTQYRNAFNCEAKGCGQE